MFPATTKKESGVFNWIQKRGILYALTQTPLLAILVGFFFRLAPYPVMMFSVLIAFAALPIWISYRKKVSTDPTEPVHHLHKYALWAFVPFTIFSLVRIPTHYLFGMAYWHPWYDFGSALTGQPANQISSLVPGALLYSLQGYSLTVGFYILFRRHSLINALLYICVFDTSIYSFIFPAFARVGMASPPRWHAVAWIAHACMGVATWAMPKFWESKWPNLGASTRLTSLLFIGAIVITPYGFPFYRAIVWQFPKQHQIDKALFDRPSLLRVVSPPVLASLSDEAVYELRMSFGPRTFKNYVGRLRQLDARDLEVTGTIQAQGQTLAICHLSRTELPSPNKIDHDEALFLERLRELDTFEMVVKCVGSRDMARNFKSTSGTELKWKATVKLVGDREEAVRSFASTEKYFLASNSNFKEE